MNFAAWEPGISIAMRDGEILWLAEDPQRPAKGHHVSAWIPTRASLLASDWERLPPLPDRTRPREAERTTR